MKSLKNRLLCFIVTLAVFNSALFAQETASTLQETLASAQANLAAGNYESAYNAFEAIQQNFAREPEVQERSFQLIVLPLHGYAAMLSEQSQVAIELYNKFLNKFPEDRTRQPFVLFNLARAYQDVGNDQEAINTYRRFVALDPNRPEAALATLEAVRLMFENSQSDDAFEALDAFDHNQPEGILKTKARLTALQEALKLGKTQKARDYLLGSEWSVTTMPELAVLAYAALEMGHDLLANRQYSDAVRCYRLVPPYSELIEAQTLRLEETKARFESRRSSVGLYQGGQFWTQFYTRLIARIEGQLNSLREAQDYTTALYMSYGQAYLLDDRPREAWVIFEYLARNPDLTKAQQSEAHYRWILAAIEVGVWEDAFRIAEGFGRRFPDSPLVPDALYLLATAYQEARQYRDAIKVLGSFLESFPEHALAPRALFVRGYNYNLMNQPVDAREDFDRFIAQHPQHALLNDARFWRALSFFAERDYTQTLSALSDLESAVKGGRLEPEIAYRKAATLYAKRDFEEALSAINNYLESYPMHQRVSEGRVLLGDIQMGRGELTIARTIFQQIGPEAGHLFTYAVFQTGKILRAVAGAEDRASEQSFSLLETHRDHFQDYINREDLAYKSRISDALYWLGWTHIELGESELARVVFEDALEQYGNDIEAQQVLQIIDGLARIEKRLTDMGRSEREAALKAWIDAEKTLALDAERLTYFARLNLYLESMAPPDEPVNLIFETVEKVPLEQLDAESLGRISAGLIKKYPRVAEDYLIALEDRYPDSQHRTYGYYSRAQLEMQSGNFEEARFQLSRFRTESPMHSLSIQVALDYALCLTQSKEYDSAREVLEDLLKQRNAKGRPHAEALLALSRNAEAAGKLKRAVPYAQRVYNVYRAYPKLAAEAYLMSADQFESLGDKVAAFRTLEEMLADERFSTLPIITQAREQHERLLSELPQDALEPSGTTEPEDAELAEEVRS